MNYEYFINILSTVKTCPQKANNARVNVLYHKILLKEIIPRVCHNLILNESPSRSRYCRRISWTWGKVMDMDLIIIVTSANPMYLQTQQR